VCLGVSQCQSAHTQKSLPIGDCCVFSINFRTIHCYSNYSLFLLTLNTSELAIASTMHKRTNVYVELYSAHTYQILTRRDQYQFCHWVDKYCIVYTLSILYLYLPHGVSKNYSCFLCFLYYASQTAVVSHSINKEFKPHISAAAQ
jgi:hypothetical protein